MKGHKTRKASKKSKTAILTIPQLRKAFDHMDHVVESQRKAAKHSFSDVVILYRDEWRKVFKHDLSPADAAAYLKFRYNIQSSKTTRRAKTRGGGALAGAPLDYSLRSGVQGVYGNFPAYQTEGLDRYYSSAITADCGKPNGFSTDASGASQGGGGLFDSLGVRLTASSTPPSILHKLEMDAMGVAPSPSSDPVGVPRVL